MAELMAYIFSSKGIDNTTNKICVPIPVKTSLNCKSNVYKPYWAAIISVSCVCQIVCITFKTSLIKPTQGITFNSSEQFDALVHEIDLVSKF